MGAHAATSAAHPRDSRAGNMPRPSRGSVAVLASLLAALFASIGAVGSARAAAPSTLRVGSQTLSSCGRSPAAYCGRLSVPLDYSMPAGPHISIAYRWYPATAPLAGRTGTVVPVEGGPGYPSIGSVSGGYSEMYGPLLEHWNMLAVDNRGTGQSSALDCPALQDFTGPTGTEAFQRTAGECAAALNHRWRYPDGSWVHASDLFNSAPAAEDLAAVIAALELGKVDLYGDSYGSFFAQVFASRFPRMVRSVILDSTYETVGLDPWYRTTVTSMPADFDAACSRAPACADAAAGSSWERIRALAESLRASPITGVVPGPGGAMQTVSMDVVGLVDLVSDAAEDPQIYRDLDAAARALLDAGDPAPLLRLYAQRLAEDEAYFGLPARQYSVELYLASACLDYPQLFEMSASSSVRAAELAAAEAALPASTFSPFSTAEWLAQDENTEAYSACLDWPSPTVAQPPTSRVPPLLPASLPVLVLGGEFDTWTPPVDIPAVLAEIGGDARFIELANSTHVVGEGDTVCGSTLVQAFVTRPQDIRSLDASCAPAVPPIHTVGVYPDRLTELPPIEPSPGKGASLTARRLAAAAVSTAGDALARSKATEVTLDHGLHGGTVRAKDGGAILELHRDQLVPEISVSGTVTLSSAPSEEDGEDASATLTVSAPGVPSASLTATWTTSGAGAEALVSGVVGGEPVSGSIPAP